jgi:DNA adenine methylase
MQNDTGEISSAHEELFEIASRLRGDFIMTYDNVDAVRVLAQRFGFDMQIVLMKNTQHTKMTELLIGPNLEWLRQPIEYCP